MRHIPAFIAFLMWSCTTYAVNSLYCPTGNHGTITVGMSESDVISECGQPLSRVQSKQSATIQVPVTQLIYTTLNKGSVYSQMNSTFEMWSIPTGSQGVSLQVNITNNQVTSISLNGEGSNASTVCGGNPIQVGDSADSVYSACGSPSLVNQTYINQPVPGKAKPEIWTYQSDPYRPAFSLTFLNGTLQSIN